MATVERVRTDSYEIILDFYSIIANDKVKNFFHTSGIESIIPFPMRPLKWISPARYIKDFLSLGLLH